MKYGVPYQGSKNKIAQWIISNLPSGDTLIDLFAGGCAVTHAAILSGKWNRIVANDIGDAPQLFMDAIHGKYANEKRWISREEFHRIKDSDTYVSLCWSFGNNRSDYLYAREIEPWKKALHFARVHNDYSLFCEFGIKTTGSKKDILENESVYKEKYIKWWLSQQPYKADKLEELIRQTQSDIKKSEKVLRDYLLAGLKQSGISQSEVQKRLGTQMAGHYFGRSQWSFPTKEMYQKMQTFMPYPTEYKELTELYNLHNLQKSLGSLESLGSLGSLERLENLKSLRRLEMLENLQSLRRLEMLQKDYAKVQIPDDAIVYADPPYKGTDCTGYKCEFDHMAFEQWLEKVPFMVIVSEYEAPAGCVEIASIKKQSTMGAGNKGGCKTEKLFVQERFSNKYKSLMLLEHGQQLTML